MNKSTNLFGFNLPNIMLYGVLAVVVVFFLGIGKMIKKTMDAASQTLGLTPDPLASDTVAQKEIESVFKRLEASPAVKSQMTANTISMANELFKAMDGVGTYTNDIQKICKRVTGPNHARAIFLAYRVRKISAFGGYISILYKSGNLLECLQFELSESDQQLDGIRQFIGTLKGIK